MCHDQGIGKTRKERMQRRKKAERNRKMCSSLIACFLLQLGIAFISDF
ncbi:hypothetical protein NC652_017292 [Populus alba x Populus x berolinensis]|uniref:Uncharacterized protein n=1 Tax=Populus alba x Populus x berolinensis TaxID=444605 RepID=A0AAD6QPV1_9ROSI|nr:hypothetical protein NC652_017292 [Populus alba x Populus x berolinensis]KAJ6994299.1 hypothetical protein NC653_017202 [Populus alba x Populus x berolinensis]